MMIIMKLKLGHISLLFSVLFECIDKKMTIPLEIIGLVTTKITLLILVITIIQQLLIIIIERIKIIKITKIMSNDNNSNNKRMYDCILKQRSNSWQSMLNILKRTVLHLGRTTNSHVCYRFLSGIPLFSQQYFRDLDVTVSSDLTYQKRIKSLVSAAIYKFYLVSR